MKGIELGHVTEEQTWDREVKAVSNVFDVRLREVWSYRDLIMLFVWRDFVSQYKQTVLGPLWQFIQPALTTLIFFLLFSKIAKIPTDGIAPIVFYMAGITMWNYFSNSLVGISNTFVYNAYIFGKVYFPRLVLPVSIVISNLVRFGVQFMLLLSIMIYYHFNGYPLHLGPTVFLIPLLLLLMATLGLGLGMIVSAVTTKYRDFGVLLTFVMQLLMYATPVVYPLSFIKGESFKWIIDINPITPVIEAFRLVLLNNGTITLNSILYTIAFALVALIVGVILFNKVERTFIDTV